MDIPAKDLKQLAKMHPDNIRMYENYTFIYTDSGELFYRKGGTHGALLADVPGIIQKIFRHHPDLLHATPAHDRRDAMDLISLTGRVSKNVLGIESDPTTKSKRTEYDLISFWNSPETIFKRLLTPCVQELQEKLNLKDETLITIKNEPENITTVKDVLKNTHKFGMPETRVYTIGGKKFTYEELANIRKACHTKGCPYSKKFLCDNLTPEFMKEHPELAGLIPPNCNPLTAIPAKTPATTYFQQGLYPPRWENFSFKEWLK